MTFIKKKTEDTTNGYRYFTEPPKLGQWHYFLLLLRNMCAPGPTKHENDLVGDLSRHKH